MNDDRLLEIIRDKDAHTDTRMRAYRRWVARGSIEEAYHHDPVLHSFIDRHFQLARRAMEAGVFIEDDDSDRMPPIDESLDYAELQIQKVLETSPLSDEALDSLFDDEEGTDE